LIILEEDENFESVRRQRVRYSIIAQALLNPTTDDRSDWQGDDFGGASSEEKEDLRAKVDHFFSGTDIGILSGTAAG
jgi:hypothetical protein